MSTVPQFFELQQFIQSMGSIAAALEGFRQSVIAARTPLDLAAAHTQEQINAANSIPFIGQDIRRGVQMVMGVPTSETQQYLIQNAQIQNENIDRTYDFIAQTHQAQAQEVIQAHELNINHQIQSVRMKAIAKAAEAGTVQGARDKYAKEKNQRDYEINALNTKLFASSDPGERKAIVKQMEALGATDTLAALERDTTIANASLASQIQQAAAGDQGEREVMERRGFSRQMSASEAMRGGAGGEDTAFRLSQEQAKDALALEIKQRRKQPEEAEALRSKQDQDREQRTREINLRVKGIETEGQEAILQSQGKFYEAQRAAFEQAANERVAAARTKGKEEVAVVEETNREKRVLMEHQITLELGQRKAAGEETVRESEHRAQQDTLRARGEFYKADEAAYKASWDEKIAKAEALVKFTEGPEKENQRKKLEALREERKADEAAHEFTKPGGTRDLQIQREQTADVLLQARGQDRTAQLKEITDKANRAFREAETPKQKKAIREQEAADIQKEEFDIKRRGLFQLGRSARHSFEMGADSMKPLENLNDVMTSADATLKSIDKYLRQQVARAAQ